MSKKNNEIQKSLIEQERLEIQKISSQTKIEKLQIIEDEVLAQSIDIIQHALNFAELGFDSDGKEEVPVEWLSLPVREKEKRIRLCKAAWMPKGDSPVGLTLAYNTMLGIIKARAVKDTGTKVLNIEKAYFPSPSPIETEYEVIDVDE